MCVRVCQGGVANFLKYNFNGKFLEFAKFRYTPSVCVGKRSSINNCCELQVVVDSVWKRTHWRARSVDVKIGCLVKPI